MIALYISAILAAIALLMISASVIGVYMVGNLPLPQGYEWTINMFMVTFVLALWLLVSVAQVMISGTCQ
jgi:hypothetical protein